METGITGRTVLIVDDVPDNISILNAALMHDYNVKVATSGKKAIDIASASPVDIILMDVMMPEMDGFETCSRLRENPVTRRIPVIFVTALHEVSDEARGFACGGVDYITKPISASIVKARVKTHLALYDQNRALEDKVRDRTAEVTESRLEIIRHLGRAAEYRDNETGRHVIRMSQYSQFIALAYGLPEDEAELVLNSAPMHDLGKIGIPDHILLKPGKLDKDEMDIIKSHCDIGHNIITPHKSILLTTAATIALTHHEKWDGSGYPRGLSGHDIPLVGRIAAIADVFDALTSKRPYKKAWTVQDAKAEICRESGAHFDPDLVQVFSRCLPEILHVKEQFADLP